MRQLLKIFLPQVLRSCAVAASAGLVMYAFQAWVSGKSHPENPVFIGSLTLAALFIVTWYYKMLFIYRNRVWIFCAPISRVKTYFLPLALDIPIVVAFALTELLILGAHAVLFGYKLGFGALAERIWLSESWVSIPLDIWSFMIFATLIYVAVTPMGAFSRLRFKLDGKVGGLWFCSALIFLILFATFSGNHSIPALPWITVYVLGMVLLFARAIQESFMLEKQANHWLTVTMLIVTLATTLSIGSLAVAKSRSQRLSDRMDAVRYLGSASSIDSEMQREPAAVSPAHP